MSAAVHARLAWLLVVLTLLQAWGAVSHIHGIGDTSPIGSTIAQRDTGGETRQSAWDEASRWNNQEQQQGHDTQPGQEDERRETDCHCAWCAPRLHALIPHLLPVPEPPSREAFRILAGTAPEFSFTPGLRGAVPPPRGPPA